LALEAILRNVTTRSEKNKAFLTGLYAFPRGFDKASMTYSFFASTHYLCIS
jgi:hypothetical protein